jgi:hypothetical protein
VRRSPSDEKSVWGKLGDVGRDPIGGDLSESRLKGDRQVVYRHLLPPLTEMALDSAIVYCSRVTDVTTFYVN